ncbi:hypothetical protein BJX66DRAFT_341811 [Aspergillus keveii]|uniref:Uncharacterized protein n=1 Tax=Aspergillus keveii TaxID=714993 RepID=A0ABR4FU73_9EURO
MRANTIINDAGLRRLDLGVARAHVHVRCHDNLDDINSRMEGLTIAEDEGVIIVGVSLGGTPSFIPASYFADALGWKKCRTAFGDHSLRLDNPSRYNWALGLLWHASYDGRIISYYLAPILRSVSITSPTQQAGINLALQAWNSLAALTGAFATEPHGWRNLWLLSASFILPFFATVTTLSRAFAKLHIKSAGIASVAMLLLFFVSYALAYTPLSITYPVEILPYHLRAKGFSLSLTEFLFPETNGRALEEIAVVFDGQGARGSGFGGDGEKGEASNMVEVEHAA